MVLVVTDEHDQVVEMEHTVFRGLFCEAYAWPFRRAKAVDDGQNHGQNPVCLHRLNRRFPWDFWIVKNGDIWIRNLALTIKPQRPRDSAIFLLGLLVAIDIIWELSVYVGADSRKFAAWLILDAGSLCFLVLMLRLPFRPKVMSLLVSLSSL
jgi:hypothetical protein